MVNEDVSIEFDIMPVVDSDLTAVTLEMVKSSPTASYHESEFVGARLVIASSNTGVFLSFRATTEFRIAGQSQNIGVIFFFAALQ